MGATSDLLVSIALVPFAVCPFADKHPSLINSLKWRVPSALENRTGADISAPNCWIILQSIIAKKNLGLPSHLKVEDGSQFAPSAKGGMYKWSLLFFWDLGLTLSLPNPRNPPALGQILANALPLDADVTCTTSLICPLTTAGTRWILHFVGSSWDACLHVQRMRSRPLIL